MPFSYQLRFDFSFIPMTIIFNPDHSRRRSGNGIRLSAHLIFKTIEPRLDWPECYPGCDHQQFIATTANHTRLRCISLCGLFSLILPTALCQGRVSTRGGVSLSQSVGSLGRVALERLEQRLELALPPKNPTNLFNFSTYQNILSSTLFTTQHSIFPPHALGPPAPLRRVP